MKLQGAERASVPQVMQFTSLRAGAVDEFLSGDAASFPQPGDSPAGKLPEEPKREMSCFGEDLERDIIHMRWIGKGGSDPCAQQGEIRSASLAQAEGVREGGEVWSAGKGEYQTIRAGHFKDGSDLQDQRDQAIGQGFPGAWGGRDLAQAGDPQGRLRPRHSGPDTPG